MRVVVPYTHIAAATASALTATDWPIEASYVGASYEAYWELLAGLWQDGETFAIVEHDIVVRPDTLDALQDCPHEWCSYGAPYYNGVYHGMGCVKFSAGLIARHPRALEQVAEYSDADHPPKHWCRLDAWLQGRVLVSEYRHRHEEVLGHSKADLLPSHGCMVF